MVLYHALFIPQVQIRIDLLAVRNTAHTRFLADLPSLPLLQSGNVPPACSCGALYVSSDQTQCPFCEQETPSNFSPSPFAASSEAGAEAQGSTPAQYEFETSSTSIGSEAYFLLIDNNFTATDLQNLYAYALKLIRVLPEQATISLMTFGKVVCAYETTLYQRASADVLTNSSLDEMTSIYERISSFMAIVRESRENVLNVIQSLVPAHIPTKNSHVSFSFERTNCVYVCVCVCVLRV
jgi:hypothetical protein